MKAWTKARVASVVRDRQTDRSWRSWKKPALQTDETCVVIVSWLSKMTRKSFAVDTVSAVEDDVVVDRGSWETSLAVDWDSSGSVCLSVWTYPILLSSVCVCLLLDEHLCFMCDQNLLLPGRSWSCYLAPLKIL